MNYKSSNYLHSFSNSHYCKYIGLSNTSSTMLHLSITSNQIDIQRKLRSKIYHTHISCNLLDITNNHYPPDKILSDNYVMCKLSLDSLTYILLHTSYKNLMMNNLYIRPNTKYNHYSFRMSQLDKWHIYLLYWHILLYIKYNLVNYKCCIMDHNLCSSSD